MIVGTVAGHVWPTKKLDNLPGGALLVIQPDHGGERLIAFDPLGCGDGEQVLIVTGEVAQSHFETPNRLVDALIVASVDQQTKEPPGQRKPKPGAKR